MRVLCLLDDSWVFGVELGCFRINSVLITIFIDVEGTMLVWDMRLSLLRFLVVL